MASTVRTRSLVSLLSSLSALFLTAALARAQGAYEPAIEYGMNPSFQTWTSRAIVFADAFQRVRTLTYWQNGPLEDAPLLPLGSSVLGAGWPDPAQLAPGERYGAMLFGWMEGTIPDGRVEPYVVTWRGTGHVRLEGQFVVAERNRGVNRVEVYVDPTVVGGSSLLSVSWSATHPLDPVRDVHVWLPGMENAGSIFWPPFLDKVRAMNLGRGPHTWRTLDWTRVNEYGRPVVLDGFVFDRAGVIGTHSPSQGTLRGVAVEYQVALCNAVGANLHFQLPHRTNAMSESDYEEYLVDQLRRVRDGSPGVPGSPGVFGGHPLASRPFAGLNPSLTVTVELSNEMWNSIFPVQAWMLAEAARKGISFHEQVASQIQLLFDTAESVFGGADARRLRTFVGGFSASPIFLEKVLSHLRPGTQVDALGPAAYLGPRRRNVAGWLAGSSADACPNCPSTSELLDATEASLDTLRPLLARHAELARSWLNPDGSRPAFEIYEGGFNLKSSDQPWAAAGRALQTDPRVFELLVDRYVPMLVEEGVDVVNWYSFMSDQNTAGMEAYGLWNDMRQELSLPVIRPYRDEGAPKAAAVYLGPPPASDSPRASAVARHAPANVPSLTVTPPVLGATLRVSVDLTPSGDELCTVVSSTLAATVPLPSGQTLLCSMDGAVFLPLRGGPVATWEFGVPNDPSLAGVRITTQAFLFGGTPGANLSNAVDLTFGR